MKNISALILSSFIILLFSSSGLFGQTNTQNYVVTKKYKQPTTSSISNPTPQVAVQNITYYDGLGRSILAIANQQSGSGKNIVTPIVYDSYGRQTKNYLPYPTQSTDLNFIPTTDAIMAQTTYQNYAGQVSYSEQLLEQSPLNRILKQAAPGNEWALGSGHEIKFEYKTNTATDVKLFKVVATFSSTTGIYEPSFTQSGSQYYPANELYKTITKNENWKSTDGLNNTVEEFKNKDGQIVLKRTYNDGAYDTYYIYDQFGNLTYVLPPSAEGSVSSPILNQLCYQYKYDAHNRLVEKRIPGKQWEFMVYDQLDRLVATGPALSPFTDAAVNTYGWLLTKYDVYNRPVITAWMPETFTSNSRASLQTIFSTATVYSVAKSTSDTTVNGVAFRYTNTVLPTSGYHVLSVSYFDNYDTNITFTPAITYTAAVTPAPVCFTNTAGNTPKGLATVSWTRVLQGISQYNADTGYLIYDTKGRVVRTFTNNYLGGLTQTDSQLEKMTGRVNYTLTTHKRISSSTALTVRDDFAYTAQDRLLTQLHTINSLPPQLIVKNEYDELGQLKNKRIGGSDVTTYAGLQKVDFNYNIRGWLTAINDVSNLSQGTDPRDLFAYKINYATVENNQGGNVSALYNGNISEVFWLTDQDNIQRKYGFRYDNLNRLTHSYYQKPNQSQTANSYGEFLNYDKNGNISSLQRNGDLDDDLNVIKIDNLTYSYAANSNRLLKVTDATNNSVGFKDDSNGTNDTVDDYDYDDNGNMKRDDNKGISSIKYNHLNLPIEIVFSGSTVKKIAYIYNSSGVKLKKVVTNGSAITYVDYLGGFQYKQTGTGTVVLEFFPHSEGYVSVTTAGTSVSYNYVFNYQDHLGNNRLSYTLNPTSNALTILEENHYYPFGFKHNNYNIGIYVA